MKWTEEDIKKLKEVARDNTYNQLAELFKRTSESIRDKCRKLGLKKNNPKNRSRDECRDIYNYFRDHGARKAQQYYKLTEYQVQGIISREKRNQLKTAAGVDVNKAEKLRMQALKFGYKCNLGDHSEDFANYCVLRLYEDKESPLKYMVIDYKEKTFGDMSTDKGKIQAAAYWSMSEVGESDDDTIRINPIDESENRQHIFEIVKDIRLVGEERVCFLLHTLFGLKQWEIGVCFGVGESRVCQILAKAKRSLRK